MPSFTVETSVDINAGRDAVWDVLTDFASYKEWNPVMRIVGAREVGTKLAVHLTGWRPHELNSVADLHRRPGHLAQAGTYLRISEERRGVPPASVRRCWHTGHAGKFRQDRSVD